MILAIDTSTQWLSVALYDATQEVFSFEKTWCSTRRHNRTGHQPLPICCRSGAAYKLLNTGSRHRSGSFTCLSIGLAFAKGMALAPTILI